MYTMRLGVLAVWLAAIPFLAGCEPSSVQPGDRAAVEAPVAKDLRAFVEGAIARANQRAAELDGKTFVEEGGLEWIMYFVRQDLVDVADLMVVQKTQWTVLIEPNCSPPPGAIERRWTDRYALAQQYSYRYELVSIGPMAVVGGAYKAESAEVELRITGTRKVGVARDEGPLPDIPEGMRVWTPSSRVPAAMQGEGVPMRELTDISMPRGAQARIEGALADQAVRAMHSAVAEELWTTLNLLASYAPDRDEWVFWTWDSPPRSVLPAELSSYTSRGEGVLSPASTQPSTSP
ncbi:MAG TPA: hypothetical protein VNA25_12310 [Phycisphaerae bacterium]|nr:hypothetical protein [Phycisphaerae bacterium]